MKFNKQNSDWLKDLCSDEIKRYEESKDLVSPTTQTELNRIMEYNDGYISFLRLIRDILHENHKLVNTAFYDITKKVK